MANIIFSEGSGLQDSIYGKSQAPIRMFIEKRGEAFEKASMIPELFSVDASRHFGEKFTTLTAMDGFLPVGENGAYPTDGMQQGFEKFFEHMTWKNSFSLSREIVEDSKSIDLRKRPLGFVTSYYRTRERFAAALYGGALGQRDSVDFSGMSFDVRCADGEKLFSKAHPSKITGETQGNWYADEFSADALAALENAMQNTRGDNGEILDISPDTILIPNIYTLKKAVFAAIGADKSPDTANNGYNYLFGRWNVIVWSYLNQYVSDGAAPWILLDSRYNDEYGGAVWLDRTKLEVRSRIDDGNDANVWQGYARFIAGFNDWRFAAVGGLAGGDELIQA
ncbi:MAG: hypothetical protein IJU78_04905 [Clostridia bacterium]|nr:hypothetical protein [Clostridia bacterium]